MKRLRKSYGQAIRRFPPFNRELKNESVYGSPYVPLFPNSQFPDAVGGQEEREVHQQHTLGISGNCRSLLLLTASYLHEAVSQRRRESLRLDARRMDVSRDSLGVHAHALASTLKTLL